MRENYWVNAFTNAELHVHCHAGSPRAWVLKSMGAPQGELYIQPGSLYPKSVGIAGLWLRDGARLPDLGANKTLYRFFDLPENLARSYHEKRNKRQAYIGVCACVPEHEILKWLRSFKESGCRWLWWAKPEPEPRHEIKVAKKVRLDHKQLFQAFDQGRSPQDLAHELNVNINTMRYVYNKWQNNKIVPRNTGHLSEDIIDQIREDLVLGELTQTEIANRYGTTRGTVNKWAKRFGLMSRGPKTDVKTKAAGNS